MRATSIGHAGILIETVDGSILCDPWFIPAFFGSWFVFPRNDQLPEQLMHRIEHPNFLYISHLHADHLDEPWLADHVDRNTTVLVPGWRCTASTIDREPLYQLAVLLFCTSSVIRPISSRWTGAPLR